jgi:multiple sugar transport system permease protein
MTSRALVRLLLVASLVITIVPLAWMILVAAQTPRRIIAPDWGLELSLSSFRSLFGPDTVYGQQVVNSVLIVLGATVLCLVVGAFAGYSLSHLSWSRQVILSVLAGTAVLQLIPPMTLIPGLYVVMSGYGLLGNVQGLILANAVFNLPFATIMMKFYFDTVPSELRESAAMDGASEFATFARVMAPLAAPGIGAVGIFTAIQVWNEFLMGLVFTTGGTDAPITVGIATLIQPQEIKFGPMAAVGTITAVPIILLVIVANRQIVAGLTRGAVKG